jgi:hypothetical protein
MLLGVFQLHYVAGQVWRFCFWLVEEESGLLILHLLSLSAKQPVLASASAVRCWLVVAGCTLAEQ